MPRIWMSQMFDAIADLGRQYLRGPAAVSKVEAAGDLCTDLLSEHGEASGTALAREVIEIYGAMDADSKRGFIEMLAEKFAPDGETVATAAASYLRDPTPEAYHDLSAAVASPLQELLHRMNLAPGGTAAIVRLRELVLASVPENPRLKTVEADLRHVFNSWFNRGFLQFEQVDWRTPAVVLEKLIAYEAVHEIRGWDDLRRRLADDRRCFAFFHPALPDEPLIFVEVALTSGLAATIQPLLDLPPQDPADEQPDTAIFIPSATARPAWPEFRSEIF
jgi:malonyl-CoA decarboxylase